MSTTDKLITRILSGKQDNNIEFSELCKVVKSFGFIERIKGDHHIFANPDVEEIINLQPNGNKAKAYQVKQVRNIILKYKF